MKELALCAAWLLGTIIVIWEDLRCALQQYHDEGQVESSLYGKLRRTGIVTIYILGFFILGAFDEHPVVRVIQTTLLPLMYLHLSCLPDICQMLHDRRETGKSATSARPLRDIILLVLLTTLCIFIVWRPF